MKTVLALISVALMATTSPVGATEAPQPGTAVKPKKERMICRSEVQIGSRVRGKRICRTRAEWRDADLQNAESVREMQRTSQAPPNG
jgi:hypothetical protein